MSTDFVAPGPGHWRLDRSHFTGGTTPLLQWVITDSVETGFRKQFPISGIPAETMSMRFVNGFAYTRLRPLISPDKPGAKPPPTIVLKVASRVHPEFRRRTKAAAANLANPPAAPVIEEWRTKTRPELVGKNLQFQDVDLAGLNDAALAAHFEAVLAHFRWCYQEHFRLHGYDLSPISQLIMAAKGWGMESGDAVAALAGASPSTLAPLEAQADMRADLAAAGVTPTSLDDIANTSPELKAKLDSFLRHHGAVLYAGYDLDAPTLGEAPDVILATIVNETGSRRFDQAGHDALVASLRAQVPADECARFDQLLADAREAMDMRDDNGPITVQWPGGLVRLAMLETGRRLHRSGRLQAADHVFELRRDEIPLMLRGPGGPTAEAVARRADQRAAHRVLTPPPTLGPPEPEPPLEALPAPLATVIQLVQTTLDELGFESDLEAYEGPPRLDGTGIGDEATTGRACVADNAEEAFDRLEPGDILVTRTTSPAYNMVLTLVGGLVTAEGGPMCHAAVLSRELNIPAVIGAADALDAISHGDTVEVDPVAGSVRVLAD